MCPLHMTAGAAERRSLRTLGREQCSRVKGCQKGSQKGSHKGLSEALGGPRARVLEGSWNY